MQTARKGDMALILPPSTIDSDQFTGLVVKCVSDPIFKPYQTPEGENVYDVLVNEIDPIVVGGFRLDVVCTHRLLPIRDPDQKVARKARRKEAA